MSRTYCPDPDDLGPVSNFETNTSSFCRPDGAGAPAERLKRRVLDIEDALIWAYRDELPKASLAGGRHTGPGLPSVSPMFSMVAFGTRVDNWTREPGFPLACGTPHPDAVLIGAAVEALERFAEQPIEAGLDLGVAALGADEEAGMRRALRSVAAILVRCAKLGKRPYWTATLYPEPVRTASGKPMVARWEDVPSKAVGGRTVTEERLMPVEVRQKGVYPTGGHCPLVFNPTPQAVLDQRGRLCRLVGGARSSGTGSCRYVDNDRSDPAGRRAAPVVRAGRGGPAAAGVRRPLDPDLSSPGSGDGRGVPPARRPAQFRAARQPGATRAAVYEAANG